MYCFHCGAENPDGVKFCRNCGALLDLKENSADSEGGSTADDIWNQDSFGQGQNADFNLQPQNSDYDAQVKKTDHGYQAQTSGYGNEFQASGSYSRQGSSVSYGEEPEKKRPSALAVVSLVLAIFSLFNSHYSWIYLLTGLIGDGIVNFLAGISGLIFAFAAKAKGDSSTVQTGGYICSLLATIFAVFWFIFAAAISPFIY